MEKEKDNNDNIGDETHLLRNGIDSNVFDNRVNSDELGLAEKYNEQYDNLKELADSIDLNHGEVTNENNDDAENSEVHPVRGDELYWNFQPTIPPSFRKDIRFSNILDSENAEVDIIEHILYSVDGTNLLAKDDTIYCMATVVGEPYYIGRLVGFEILEEYKSVIQRSLRITTRFPVKYFKMRLNWFYRTRDIVGTTADSDPRYLYASQMEDVMPIESYRGKCTICHVSEIIERLPNEFEVYQRSNIFYFSELYDIYSGKFYNVYPTKRLLHLFSSTSFFYVLNKRFRYLFTEKKYPLERISNKYIALNQSPSSTTDYIWDKSCRQCKEWCSGSECLRCDECKVSIHNRCLNPPLSEPLDSDVVWLCDICVHFEEDNENVEELAKSLRAADDYIRDQYKLEIENIALKALEAGVDYNKENVSFFYLGENSINNLDALLDQTLLLPYPLNNSITKDKSRNPWVTWDVHPYTNDRLSITLREDSNENIWDFNKLIDISSDDISNFLVKCEELYNSSSLERDFIEVKDTLLMILWGCNNNVDDAYLICKDSIDRHLFESQVLNEAELKQFKECIVKFGNELQLIQQVIKTQNIATLNRYFCLWKSLPRSIESMINFATLHFPRKEYILPFEKSQPNENIEEIQNLLSLSDILPIVGKFTPDYVVKYVDDSSLDINSSINSQLSYKCEICEINYSYMWYRYAGDNTQIELESGIKSGEFLKEHPNTRSKKESKKSTSLICIRCARLWRRYAVKWENPISVLKKLNENSGVDLDLFLLEILEETNDNKFKSSPIEAHKRHLEYELVQDAEMIFKQRDSLLADPDKVGKLHAKVPWVRRLHYKSVQKTVDKNEHLPIRMKYDLADHIKRNSGV
ncbi:hypothetical protein Kpol_228p2 [Vanderwaltozyma polyspora DSM 70294]|uniref:PHD-type domain-containing protein n=1 Tax=Vanderwaltozyma polyspora (strain ATCC 22028 / DSM 70294 / BCRC 21397 / CBS 2163 / NBRC 10782 / NRRL Y-8283 / UCD 57-17) TaxID=436907 RepID=A7TTG6_VANPO|nr:uncharacterized protein Kpol_228p2 [Vanderwaltozyma polyspora DSM 70294]EDO14439.1 hypothetical protein Kpol_228p2 [Vanderwaltozyma polyspora DSM 70294]